MKNKRLVIGLCIVAIFIGLILVSPGLWIQTLSYSEKFIFENTILQKNRFDLPNSWFELRSDDFDANIPEAVIEDFQNSFLEYLNSGGDLAQLKTELSTTPGILYVDIQQVDFSGDSSNEIVIGIEFIRRGRHGSIIWVAGQIEGSYKILFQRNSGWLTYNPRILLIEDLNNDGLKEVVASTTWIGSDQEINLYVLAQYFPGQQVTTLFTQDLVPLGQIDVSIIDTDGDMKKEILLSGRRWHSGNLNEKITYEYKWDGNRYSLSKSYAP